MSRALKSFSPIFIIFIATLCSAQDLASFEKHVLVKKLPNGLTAIVCQRPDSAPVFSFNTNVDAGSVQDPMGKTGLAHMFEHMAFKGTDTIGTKNYSAEKVALAKVEKAYAAYLHERDKPVGRDEAKLKQLEKAWQDGIKDAQQYVVPNEFGEIIERNGGEDLNASTSDDNTEYHYSFAVNRLEIWAYLESERFIHPVFREFYKERNVVIEERRMRTDSNPIGRLVEQFIAEAFAAHPYHRPTIGYLSDLNSFSATDAEAFFNTYYIPSNMVVAVAGDVDPVRDKKIASQAAGFTNFPGGKYPHLFCFFAFPMPGHKPEETGQAIQAELERLKKEDISDDELKMVKTRAKANLIRGLDSNEGLASSLAIYQTLYGDWRELFHTVDRIEAVTKADIRRVANQVFVPTNRTVGVIETAAAASGGVQ